MYLFLSRTLSRTRSILKKQRSTFDSSLQEAIGAEALEETLTTSSSHFGHFRVSRSLFIPLIMLLGLSSAVIWNWKILMEREEYDIQERFSVDTDTIARRLQAHMRSYEMVLRGVSSAFAGIDAKVPYKHWVEIIDQIRVWDLYPGISSLVWARYLKDEEGVQPFLDRMHAEGRPNFTLFPPGKRSEYLPIEYIGPMTERTNAVVGLDLLTQVPQGTAIRQAIDFGQTMLSAPLPDLYVVSQEKIDGMGVIIYFPVYATGMPPATVEERRATFLGLTNAAFRGQELIDGVFSEQLGLFHIHAYDQETGLDIFDSRQGQISQRQDINSIIDDNSRFHTVIDIPIYGQTWMLELTGTDLYEKGLIAGRSHNFALILGLTVSALLSLLVGIFMYYRDRQLHDSRQIAVRLHKQAQQLMLADRYKSEFLANMSHELRTPLNSILILSDHLRQNSQGNLDDKQIHHADIVYKAGSDLLQLINDVLDLAKIEAGRIHIELMPLNLQELLVDLDSQMQPLAEARGLNLHIAMPPPESGVPLRIQTDRVRLHQILRNLLSNAIKFTETGQVHVLVTAGAKQKDGRVVIKIAVRDTGIGIAPEHHTQVFEAFTQVDGSTKRRAGGTGLGLAITKQLIEALDGEIELQSALGQGSTFTVKLPCYPAENSQNINILPPQRSGSGPLILIVEDDKHFADSIIVKAHTAGFSTLHCTTGTQAMEQLAQESFIAVILDIMLPDISGWQVFRRARSLKQHTHIPVNIISSLPQPSKFSNASFYYLTKPLEKDILEELFAQLKQNLRPKNQATSVKNAPQSALLLIEDVTAEREYYHKMLSKIGFDVISCETASSAREIWQDRSFDVLVVDLNLPDCDGFALLDEMDKVRSLQDTQIVIHTGLDISADGMQRLKAYSAIVVSKTDKDINLLVQAVQNFLNDLDRPPAHPLQDTPQIADTTAVASTPPPPASPAVTLSTEPPASPSATPSVSTSIKGRHLLLVDDDMRNVYATSALLDDFGLIVSTASNGEEAITVFKRDMPDLILMDMSMPVMDGYTATNLLKKQHGCTKPIIAMTAHAMVGDREKCLAAGTDDYIAKPVNREELYTLLTHWLTSTNQTTAHSI